MDCVIFHIIHEINGSSSKHACYDDRNDAMKDVMLL